MDLCLGERWCERDAVVEDETVAAPVSAAAPLEVAQDAALQLVHVAEAFEKVMHSNEDTQKELQENHNKKI